MRPCRSLRIPARSRPRAGAKAGNRPGQVAATAGMAPCALNERLAHRDIASPRQHGAHEQEVGEHDGANLGRRGPAAIPVVADPDHDDPRHARQHTPEPPAVRTLHSHGPGQEQDHQGTGRVEEADVRRRPQSGRTQKKSLVDRYAERGREQKQQAIFPDHPEQDAPAQNPRQQAKARHAESNRRNQRDRQLRDGDLGSRRGRRSEHNHQRYIDIGAEIHNVLTRTRPATGERSALSTSACAHLIAPSIAIVPPPVPHTQSLISPSFLRVSTSRAYHHLDSPRFILGQLARLGRYSASAIASRQTPGSDSGDCGQVRVLHSALMTSTPDATPATIAGREGDRRDEARKN